MIGKINHVAIVVADLDAAAATMARHPGCRGQRSPDIK